jgi:hypothetical protein
MTRAAAIRHGRADRAAAVAALMAAGVLAGCAPGAGQGPEAIELANIAEPNIVPKSSPAQFARAFERFCLDTPAEARAETLRAADYVPFAPVRASTRVIAPSPPRHARARAPGSRGWSRPGFPPPGRSNPPASGRMSRPRGSAGPAGRSSSRCGNSGRGTRRATRSRLCRQTDQSAGTPGAPLKRKG